MFTNFHKYIKVYVCDIMDLLPIVENIKVEIEEQPEIIEEEKEPEPEPIVEKPRINVEDIFAEEPKKTKKPKGDKPKRVMTEKQLEVLAKAREKGLETRRKKAAERRKMKELESKVKEKKIEQLEEYVTPKSAPVVKPVREEPKVDYAAMTSLAVKQALEQHEAERQKRKARKKAIQADEQHKQNLSNLIMIVPNPPARYGESGFFDKCF